MPTIAVSALFPHDGVRTFVGPDETVWAVHPDMLAELMKEMVDAAPSELAPLCTSIISHLDPHPEDDAIILARKETERARILGVIAAVIITCAKMEQMLAVTRQDGA
ncbi:MAG: hypothetical protein ACYDD1_00090 [Caulobacteraceae bacterium]